MTVESLQLPPNVRPIPWAPQNDVLAHPQTKVFVTHAGANSIYEAAYHATPVVSLPFFADQPHNAAKVHPPFGCTPSAVRLQWTRRLTDCLRVLLLQSGLLAKDAADPSARCLTR